MRLSFDIPAGWTVRRLDEVAEVRSGVAKGRTGLKRPINVPYLRVANVQDGYLDLDEIKTIEVDEHEVQKYALREGDVLMNEGGDFDKLGRGHIWRDEIPVCLHQNHVFAVRPKKEKLDSRFLNLFTGSFHGKLYFLACSKQSTNLASMNSSQLKAMPIPVPPLGEQKRIAEILGAWDDSIERVNALIQAKQKLKRALMQQLLTGHRRFPQFKKEKWRSARLRDVAERVTRKNGTGCSHVLTASGEHGLVDQAEFFDRAVASEDLSDYFLLRKGEFAYNRSSMNGYPFGATKRLERYEEGVLSILYICFCVDEARANPDFMAHLFDSGLFNRGLRAITQVGARAHGLLNVTPSDFMGLEFMLPPLEEQVAIANALSEAGSEVKGLAAKKGELEHQKRGLMQRLLTGQIRVKVKARAAEVARA